jgi:hypothetical protein
MIDVRSDVQTILKNVGAVTALTAICPADNIHIIRAPRDNKAFPRIVIIEADNAPEVTADNKETASRIRVDLWLWAETQADLFSLIGVTNTAMKINGWARVGTGPDGFVLGPDVYEKMLSFEGVFINNEGG